MITLYISPTKNTKVVIIKNEPLSIETFQYFPLLDEVISEVTKSKTRQQLQSQRTYIVNNYEEYVSISGVVNQEELFGVLKNIFKERHLYGCYIK